MTNEHDLIRRGDAMEIGSAHGWDTDLFRSAIAALPAVVASQPADPVRVMVKPLVWEHHPMGWIASPPTGRAYIIDVRVKGRVMFIKGMNPPPKCNDLESAFAVAQADYEACVNAAIDVQPDPRDAQIAALVEAATEAEEVLSLVEKPETPDPRHHEMIKELGRKIGFGAIMSTASAGWREVLVEKGYAAGGEFVSGPCHSTIVATLKQLRAALAAAKGGDA